MKLSILNNLFTECLWWLLFWMFLAFLLGWILRKYLGSNDDNSCCDELAEYKRKYQALEAKSKQKAQTKDVVTAPVAVAVKKEKPKTAYSKLKNDNLQIIEGIGPKMDEVLKKHNMTTWAAVAEKTATELRAILDKENPTRYKIIDPTTWPDQAKLAVNEQWEKLIKMQKEIDYGHGIKEDADSKLEKIMIKLGLLKKWKKDDLKAIAGIGPKIVSLLNETGIKTWKDLASAPVEKLKDILNKAGSRYKFNNPDTWAKQAQLAEEEKWEELQEYQDSLKK